MADMNPHGPPEGHATTTMPTLPPELDRAIQVALQAAMAQLNSATSQRFEAIENHVRHFTSTYESRLASAEHKHETTAPDPAPATVPVPSLLLRLAAPWVGRSDFRPLTPSRERRATSMIGSFNWNCSSPRLLESSPLRWTLFALQSLFYVVPPLPGGEVLIPS